jgi:hypothetical protein
MFTKIMLQSLLQHDCNMEKSAGAASFYQAIEFTTDYWSLGCSGMRGGASAA